MKRRVMVALFLACVTGAYAANDDNRPLGAQNVRQLLQRTDENQVIYFDAAVTAGPNLVVLPDHSQPLGDFAWPSGVSWSTQPPKMNGGRMYAAFQAIATATNTPAKLYWSFEDNGVVSVTTGNYLLDGEWWPPAEWPFVYQGTVTVRSTAAYTLSGFIITEKKR